MGKLLSLGNPKINCVLFQDACKQSTNLCIVRNDVMVSLCPKSFDLYLL